MKTLYRVLRKGQPYTLIDNKLSRDHKIDHEDRGFLVYILSLPEKIKLSKESIQKISKWGESKYLQKIKEYEKLGYLIRLKIRISGKYQKDNFYFCADRYSKEVFLKILAKGFAKKYFKTKTIPFYKEKPLFKIGFNNFIFNDKPLLKKEIAIRYFSMSGEKYFKMVSKTIRYFSMNGGKLNKYDDLTIRCLSYGRFSTNGEIVLKDDNIDQNNNFKNASKLNSLKLNSINHSIQKNENDLSELDIKKEELREKLIKYGFINPFLEEVLKEDNKIIKTMCKIFETEYLFGIVNNKARLFYKKLNELKEKALKDIEKENQKEIAKKIELEEQKRKEQIKTSPKYIKLDELLNFYGIKDTFSFFEKEVLINKKTLEQIEKELLKQSEDRAKEGEKDSLIQNIIKSIEISLKNYNPLYNDGPSVYSVLYSKFEIENIIKKYSIEDLRKKDFIINDFIKIVKSHYENTEKKTA